MMLENFEVVSALFEGQVHERPQFKLSIEGQDYKGVFHDEEVHWYQPHPHHKLEEDQVNAIESDVRELLNERYLH